MSNINDDYWNTSSASNLNFFDDEDLSTSQIDVVANDVFSSKDEETNIFAIDFIISEKCLASLLSDIDTQNVYVVLPVEELINKMVHGQRLCLEMYKSYKDKVLLLDEALKTQNGDIILRVTDFLKKTLKFNIFCNVLMKRKVALVQYSNFLKSLANLEELENLYMATGFTSNIRDLYFLNNRNGVNKQETLSRLKSFISSNSQYMSSFNEEKLMLDHVRFLEWQIIKKEESDSVIDQLALICKNQWEQNSKDDIVNEFKVLFKINDLQFEWIVINCLSSMGSWKKLIGMFVKPNWLTKKNILKTAITSDHFIWGISRHNPPKNVLEQFLACLSDTEKSLALAEKFQCHKFMTEYYINQRDRLGLLSCMDKVITNSEEYHIIRKALESQDKKWKN